MKIFFFCLALGIAHQALAAGVVGAAEGFAKGVTGGGSTAPVTPSTVAELTNYLADAQPRVILLTKEFNFKGTEGTVKEMGCRPLTKCSETGGGQDSIDHANWCSNRNAGAGSKEVPVTYDRAATSGLVVGSNKSIVGVGSKGVIRGKGLYIAKGAKNIIIQNVHITDLNPQYIWGGDAIAIDNADLVWIDHCKFSLIGRQMLVLGNGPSNRVSVTYNEFDGATNWSASCDGHHYWTIYFTGSSDMVTFKGNYVHHTSGRSPKIGGNTLLHAVNNVWLANSGHAFDVGSPGSNVLIEGNVFQDVVTPLLENKGKVFAPSSVQTSCSASLGRACQANAFSGSGALTGSDSSFLSKFSGKAVAAASAASAAISSQAVFGKTA